MAYHFTKDLVYIIFMIVNVLNKLYVIMYKCYREDSKVSHYIINKIQENNETKYRIGDQVFSDLPGLLAFYKLHYLDTTPLLKPAVKPIEKVIAKYDFVGNVIYYFINN